MRLTDADRHVLSRLLLCVERSSYPDLSCRPSQRSITMRTSAECTHQGLGIIKCMSEKKRCYICEMVQSLEKVTVL